MGWYHTGPRIREADLDVSALLGSYCENPLLVICEVEVRSRLTSRCLCFCRASAALMDGVPYSTLQQIAAKLSEA